MVSWSTGKDAAWCLHQLREGGEVDVVGLLSTVTADFGRVSIHGTRLEVLRAQAEGLGLPVWQIPLPYPCDNTTYENAMRKALSGLIAEWKITHVAFGDLFLEDVRAYREERMATTPIEPLFPLWQSDTTSLAREMTSAGLRAVIVSAPENSVAAHLVGSEWSAEIIADASPDLDLCGENGEFHTCFVGGLGMPDLQFELGRKVNRDGAVYQDLKLT